jgi:hypothetical protein
MAHIEFPLGLPLSHQEGEQFVRKTLEIVVGTPEWKAFRGQIAPDQTDVPDDKFDVSFHLGQRITIGGKTFVLVSMTGVPGFFGTKKFSFIVDQIVSPTKN